MSQQTRFHFLTLDSESLELFAEDNVSEASIDATTGTVTVVGDYPFRGSDSGSVTLVEGTTVTLSGKGGNPIGGVTITASGTASIALSF